MSQAAVPRVFLYLLASFFVAFSKANSHVQPDNCLEFDVDDLEDYLSKLNFENVPTISMMIGEFKCPVTALPFGALKSDWARLLLLQRAQPRESILLKKLGRLFRILVTAYFQMEERFDVVQSGSLSTSSPTTLSTNESIINVDSKDQTKELGSTITDPRETNETSMNLVSTITFNEESNSTIEIKRTTAASSSVTSEVESDDFDAMRNNIPSVKVTLSPVVDGTMLCPTSKQIDEKSTTTFANIIDFSYISAEKQKYREITTSSAIEYVTADTGNNFTMNNSCANIFPTNKLNENRNDSVTDGDIKISTTEFGGETTNLISATTSISGLRDSNDQRSMPKLTLPVNFNTAESNEIKGHVSLKKTNAGSGSSISQEISDLAKSENISLNPTNRPIGRVSQVFQRVPCNSVNSTVPCNKIEKPSSDNEVWKYIAISPKVNSATVTTKPTSALETGSANQSEGDLIKTRKRGSTNTNIEKSFRWFYTFAHGSKNPFDRSVHIKCNGNKHKDGE
ncbi:uncharacterized protein LOC122527480 isoform X2 [Frieseomelitta varia]|uniref:uncharacterized protein LOC122527480 isoform X2 n=1 Tax=Frieseomelitta varia TaxID=561572 RepID=UPI001CB6AE6F|nr:uncharacterized protein LOC122527480 isoform X2 [Frieseomelitta varia]